MNALILQTLRCEETSRPPVWLMRQAGRYQPEYRALRSKHSLWELFHKPELAAQVTLLPVDILGVDAAILFSDILVIAEVFGLKVHFPEQGGPSIQPALCSAADVEALAAQPVEERLSYVQETIALLKPQLKVPLIGFCGGPFTVATYLIEKEKREAWMAHDPQSFHQLLEKISEASLAYLRLQIAAGVQVVQVFDSWASLLTPQQFAEFSLKYLHKIVEGIRATGVPLILFCRNSSLYPEELASLKPAGISFDWHQEMALLRQKVPFPIAIQGNLDPEILRGPYPLVKEATKKLLRSMKNEKGWIVNLGHGILPDTPVENVRCFVELVKESDA